MQIGLGLSITSQLRFGTALYAVNSFDPDFVLDFKNSYYRKGGTDSTLSGSVTHARAGNATMVDSDGLLKWSPHNLFKNSEDFSGGGWYRTQYTVTPNNAIAPDGTTTANLVSTTDGSASYLMDDGAAFTALGNYTLKVWAKANTGDSTLRVWTWMLGGSSGSSGLTTFNLTNEWQLLEINATITTVGAARIRIDQPTAGASSFYLWGAHAYRSDLGGMVNNPATGDSYVPTTSSAVYAPRVGHHVYNGSAWVNEGILHESEARTNLLPTSTILHQWSKLNVNASLSTVTSPSGSQDAVLVKPTAGTHSFTFLWYTVQYNTGVITSISVFAKASGKDFMTMLNSSGSTNYASFNLSTGAVSNVTAGYTANMEDFGNGWYRCSVVTPTGFNERAIFAVADANNSATSTANGEDGILLYGPQLEAGSTASSYIPTSGSTVTRAADTLTVPAANLPYSSTNMSIQIDGKITYADDGSSDRFIQWGNQGADEIRLNLEYGGAQTGSPTFIQRAGGVIDILSDLSAYSPNINVPFNIASRHGSSFMNGAVDGTALTADTTPTALPNLSSSTLSLGFDFMGTIAQFRMWDEDLTDAGITEAST